MYRFIAGTMVQSHLDLFVLPNLLTTLKPNGVCFEHKICIENEATWYLPWKVLQSLYFRLWCLRFSFFHTLIMIQDQDQRFYKLSLHLWQLSINKSCRFWKLRGFVNWETSSSTIIRVSSLSRPIYLDLMKIPSMNQFEPRKYYWSFVDHFDKWSWTWLA